MLLFIALFFMAVCGVTNSMPNQSFMSEAVDLLSRTLAVSLVMFGFGWVGNQVDRWLGTNFVAAIGFLFGMTIGLFALIVTLQKSNRKK